MSTAARRGLLTAGLLVIVIGSLGFLLGQTSERAKINVVEDIDAARAETAREDIEALLMAQADAWSTGDLDGFMAGYVPDQTLRFASGGEVRTGWRTALDRYRARYPDRAAMGTLVFSDLDIDILDTDDALVFGRWELRRDADTPSGLFTLHMVRRGGDWLIQSDHTSSDR